MPDTSAPEQLTRVLPTLDKLRENIEHLNHLQRAIEYTAKNIEVLTKRVQTEPELAARLARREAELSIYCEQATQIAIAIDQSLAWGIERLDQFPQEDDEPTGGGDVH